MMRRLVIEARASSDVVVDIVLALEKSNVAQVPGYKAFRFVRESPASVVLEREGGTEAIVPKSDLELAVESIRRDHSIYIEGPGRLRECGITHVTSPVWALVRMLPLNELIR